MGKAFEGSLLVFLQELPLKCKLGGQRNPVREKYENVKRKDMKQEHSGRGRQDKDTVWESQKYMQSFIKKESLSIFLNVERVSVPSI